MSIWDDIFTGGEAAFDQLTGQTSTAQLANTAGAGNWLTGLAGDIASGLEGAFVAFLHDIWKVVLAPVAIGTGLVLIIVAFLLFFKDDIMSLVSIAGTLGMLA